ncbi:MAG TPA: hypothetical protein VNW99_08175 [Cytophagaceae bacterium]|jgi:hypothetical protein|nr:hypothetical protein [Cytophagaceae bacterium]
MKKLLLYSQILFVLILFSCKKKERIGPSLNEMSGPVTITATFTASNATPDFSTGGSIYFSAAFQNDANWMLTLTGNISGAVKTFKGTGKIISASNATWDGSSGNTLSFRAEPVTAVLNFPTASSAPPIVATSITINITPKNLNALGKLIADFHNAAKIKDANYTTTIDWQSDWVPTMVAGSLPLVDGNSYLVMSGTPWQPGQSPYIDFLTIYATAGDSTYGTYFPLYADPSQVYLNFYIYNSYNPQAPLSNTNNPYAWLQVNIIEEGGVTWTYQIKNPTWLGWKLFSINYNSFISSNSSVIPNPTKVKAVQLVILSSAPLTNLASYKVTVPIDHLIWTFNKPYQP